MLLLGRGEPDLQPVGLSARQPQQAFDQQPPAALPPVVRRDIERGDLEQPSGQIARGRADGQPFFGQPKCGHRLAGGQRPRRLRQQQRSEHPRLPRNQNSNFHHPAPLTSPFSLLSAPQRVTVFLYIIL